MVNARLSTAIARSISNHRGVGDYMNGSTSPRHSIVSRNHSIKSGVNIQEAVVLFYRLLTRMVGFSAEEPESGDEGGFLTDHTVKVSNQTAESGTKSVLENAPPSLCCLLPRRQVSKYTPNDLPATPAELNGLCMIAYFMHCTRQDTFGDYFFAVGLSASDDRSSMATCPPYV